MSSLVPAVAVMNASCPQESPVKYKKFFERRFTEIDYVHIKI